MKSTRGTRRSLRAVASVTGAMAVVLAGAVSGSAVTATSPGPRGEPVAAAAAAATNNPCGSYTVTLPNGSTQTYPGVRVESARPTGTDVEQVVVPVYGGALDVTRTVNVAFDRETVNFSDPATGDPVAVKFCMEAAGNSAGPLGLPSDDPLALESSDSTVALLGGKHITHVWIYYAQPAAPPPSGLALAKTVADSGDPDSLASAGETLTYTLTVTNNGPVALTGVKVSDPRLGLSGVLCAATLAPGASATCPSATSTATDADVALGHVDNTATATADGGLFAMATARIDTVAPVVQPAGLSIEKSVDVSQAKPGDVVTYTLLVRNAGPGDAQHVTVSDLLPAGTTFASAPDACTATGNEVSCDLPLVPAGTSVPLQIQVTVDPLTAANSHLHQIDVTKVEAHLSLAAGETNTARASCPTGYFATDGSVRLDAVDQGTGTFADAVVLESRGLAGFTGWFGKVRNDATGQAQVKVNVVCVSARTTSGDDHSHALVTTDFQNQTHQFTTDGTWQADLSCAPGFVPIAPSFTFTSGEGIVSTRRTATGMHFRVDGSAGAAVSVAMRCLSTSTASTNGHTHDLSFSDLTGSLTVPAGSVAERSLTCPDGYKGIVAWADMDRGLVSMGNDPQPITRVFRFYNPTDSDLTADYGLLCVGVRTWGGLIRNVGSVATTSPDATTSDDTSSASFTVTSIAAAPTAQVVDGAAGTQVKVGVTATLRQDVHAKLLAVDRVSGTDLRKGDVLAGVTTTLRTGRNALRLDARNGAAGALLQGKVTRAKLVITSHSGTRTIRFVRMVEVTS